MAIIHLFHFVNSHDFFSHYRVTLRVSFLKCILKIETILIAWKSQVDFHEQKQY